MDVNFNLAANLRGLRGMYGVSAAQVGERIGVHAITIYNWERGKTVPKMADIEKLATVFNVTIMTLLDMNPLVKSLYVHKDK